MLDLVEVNRKNKEELELYRRIYEEKIKNPKIREFLQVLNDPEIQGFIEHCRKMEGLNHAVQKNDRNIRKDNQKKCEHKKLLFIEHAEKNSAISPDTNYCRCMCLDCEHIGNFIVNDDTDIMYIGTVNYEELPIIKDYYDQLCNSRQPREKYAEIIVGKLKDLRIRSRIETKIRCRK